MNITLELSDTGESVDVDVPAVPRIGEEVLWTDEVSNDEGTYERMRMYRVRMVDWTMSQTEEPFILLRLDFIEDNSGAP
ncbi:hypothetical protein ACQEV4_01330 [Streptomyces shenzhenensis]|uniref:hypothetical protein n=1 Tax=Streptomyces shenzhenensis TaxID=943815 RepID=UPI003D8A9032